MHNFYANYLKNLSVLDIVEEKSSYLKQIRKPKLSDKELISINLTAEYLGIDSASELKNMCQIEHSRHRSFSGFVSNTIAALIAYSFFNKKPAIKFQEEFSSQIVLF